jgi:hypothetical protein
VRQKCVSQSQFFLQYHPELFKDIVEQLKVRQHDPEETVRMEVVNVILTVAKNDFTVCTEELLSFIRERTLDKKVRLNENSRAKSIESEIIHPPFFPPLSKLFIIF